MSDLLKLNDEEQRRLESWQCVDAHDALRLLIAHYFQPEIVSTMARRALPHRGGLTLVEVLLKNGPNAALLFVAEEKSVLSRIRFVP